MAKPIGRPSEYTPELAAKLCAKLSEGISLRTVCLDEEMPDKSTVFRWLSLSNENEWAKDFRDQYARAKQEAADANYEILEDIGDESISAAKFSDPKAANAVVSAYKLKSDNLKWAMAKQKPRKYGDKLDLTSAGEKIEQAPLVVSTIKGRDVNSQQETS